jgi:hypothetical protein
MPPPLHIGNSALGRLVPAAGASIPAITGIGLSGLLYGSAIVTVGIVISPALMRERTHRLKSKTQSLALHRHWSRTNSGLARQVSGSTRPFSLRNFVGQSEASARAS